MSERYKYHCSQCGESWEKLKLHNSTNCIENLKKKNYALHEWLRKIYDGIYGDDFGDLLCEFTDEDVEQIAVLLKIQKKKKCTCGNDGKPVWEHTENCPVYAPF